MPWKWTTKIQPNLKNKSVALVGPAVPVGDQSEQVEACDFIIRSSYRFNERQQVSGYGERTEAAFYNIQGAVAMRNQSSLWEHLPWIILKAAAGPFDHPGVIKIRDPFSNANQMPILLHWVEGFEPLEIHVFGSDFYVSGPTGTHSETTWEDIQMHNQSVQHAWMKAFQERTGLIKGDSRMVELLSLTTEQVVAQVNEAWRGI